jgi:ATP-dependent Clp protease protease subunit
MKKDFINYLNKHRNINSLFIDDYFKQYKNVTQHIIDDSINGIMVDVFSKLIDNRIIFLSTEMDSDICNIIKAQILYLEQIGDEDISIYIDSPGGSVYSGLGLLDTMEYVKPDISTINTGLAASMAAVLLCSGAKGKRKALKRSRTMIHQPLGYTGFAQASDLEIDAKQINHLKKDLYEIISDKTGQPYDKVYRDGDRDYWMSSTEAKKYGMIDEIVVKKSKKS